MNNTKEILEKFMILGNCGNFITSNKARRKICERIMTRKKQTLYEGL
jgi:hypothetical protein